MTPSPIIHVGYHKTGSTWFQKRLYATVTSHRYVPRREVQEVFLMPSALAFDPARARARLAPEAPDRPVLLCEEELSGNPHSAGMRGSLSKDVAERLHATLPEALVVIFIRNQVDMAATLYGHYVREGGTHGPRRYLCPERWRNDVRRHPFKYPLFSLDFLDYRGLIGHYRALFGHDRVLVFAFEQFRADPRAFIGDYAHALGLLPGPGPIDYGPINTGLRRNVMTVARLLNRLTYRSVLDKQWTGPLISNKIRSNLPLWLNRTPLAGPRLSPTDILGEALAAEIAQRFAPVNGVLIAQTGLPLDRLGYAVA